MKKLIYRFMVAVHQEEQQDLMYFFKTEKDAKDFIYTMDIFNVHWSLSDLSTPNKKNKQEMSELN